MAMSRYLVTGVAGFIGARTAEVLISSGNEVVGVDNLNDAYDVRIKHFRLAKLQGSKGFTFHRLDIGDALALSAVGNQYDAIIHLAARAGVRASVEQPRLFYDTNVLGTLNLLEIARSRSACKFLLASTSSIYGANPPYPTPESASSSEPLQPYAASKKAAEVLAHSYHYLHGIDVSVVRYFTVYGPAGRPDLAMFRFCKWIAEGQPLRVNGDGHQSRGFTYVDDIVDGTILALARSGFEIFNLGGHEAISINGLIELLETALGRKADVVYGPPNLADMVTNLADTSKATKLLGWSPRINLQSGLRKLVDWYLAERSWAKDVLTE